MRLGENLFVVRVRFGRLDVQMRSSGTGKLEQAVKETRSDAVAAWYGREETYYACV